MSCTCHVFHHYNICLCFGDILVAINNWVWTTVDSFSCNLLYSAWWPFVKRLVLFCLWTLVTVICLWRCMVTISKNRLQLWHIILLWHRKQLHLLKISCILLFQNSSMKCSPTSSQNDILSYWLYIAVNII